MSDREYIMRAIRFILGFLLMALADVSQGHVSIASTVVAQQEGSKLVDIGYDLSCTGTNVATVFLLISKDGLQIDAPGITGDFGENLQSGSGKKIVWDAGVDWNGNVEELTFLIVANDGSTGTVVSAVCPTSKTGQTISFLPGDDGDLEAGVSFTDPRFSELSNTVIDNYTGLEWAKDPHSISGNTSYLTWVSAIERCNTLELSGHDDWRLPSLRELLSLVDYGQTSPSLPSGHPFSGIQTAFEYWTSTTEATSPGSAFSLDMSTGRVSMAQPAKTSGRYVWPVRRAGSNVARTGQTISYGAGDDGDLEKGEEWPVPRFVDRGDGTVFDKLTGLEWVKMPQALLGNIAQQKWSDAVSYCSRLIFANHADWRLPNVREQESLLHYGSGTWGNKPYEWLNSDETPFSLTGEQGWAFWSGTSCSDDALNSFLIDLSGTQILPWTKTTSRYVWPVRTPQPEDEGLVSVTTNALVDSRTYILNVESTHGAPVPAAGTHSNYCWRSVVDCSVNAAVWEDGRHYVCTGWWGSLGSGDNNQTGSLVLSNAYSSLIWKWREKSSPDSDSDGMNDVWESDNFQTLARGAEGDFDGDGQHDLHEFMFGTSPTNEASRFIFSGTVNSGAMGYDLLFPSITGRVYDVEYRDNLLSVDWSVLTNNVAGTGLDVSVSDEVLSNRFYRVRVELPE